MTTFERDALIMRYISLAESLAKKRLRTTPQYIDLSDLISVAYMGLVTAANKFNPVKSSFITYAYYRINGELCSFIRSEIQARRQHVSIEAEDTQGGCLRDILEDRPQSLFESLVEPLNPLGKQLMMWYYVEQMTMKEIGRKIGVQQPRISKLLHYYTKKLVANRGGAKC